MHVNIDHLGRASVAVARMTPNGFSLLGTAFIIGNDLLVTTKHVTGADDAQLFIILPKATSLNDYQDTTDNQAQLLAVQIHAIDPFMDLCVLKVTNGHANEDYVRAGSDHVKVGAPVILFGFPHADQGRRVLTYQRTEVGAKVLIVAGEQKFKHLVLNIQARPGQSGSPIFTEDGRLVAILIGSYAPGGGGGISLGGVDPHTLHQTTHAISAEYIEELIK